MCTSPMASLLGVDCERGSSSVTGSPLGTSAPASEARNSSNSFWFLSWFLSPDEGFRSPSDLCNLRSCPGSLNSFCITSQIKRLILWAGLYLSLPTSSSYTALLQTWDSASVQATFFGRSSSCNLPPAAILEGPSGGWPPYPPSAPSFRGHRRDIGGWSWGNAVPIPALAVIVPHGNGATASSCPLVAIDHGVLDEILDSDLVGSRCRRGKPDSRAT